MRIIVKENIKEIGATRTSFCVHCFDAQDRSITNPTFFPSCSKSWLHINIFIHSSSNITPVGPPLWSSGQEFLPTDPEVPGFIPGATRLSEK
jgi:hypothetical protein